MPAGYGTRWPRCVCMTTVPALHEGITFRDKGPKAECKTDRSPIVVSQGWGGYSSPTDACLGTSYQARRWGSSLGLGTLCLAMMPPRKVHGGSSVPSSRVGGSGKYRHGQDRRMTTSRNVSRCKQVCGNRRVLDYILTLHRDGQVGPQGSCILKASVTGIQIHCIGIQSALPWLSGVALQLVMNECPKRQHLHC